MKPGGELLTVMDDSVLSGKSSGFARDWLREHFIVKAVISLPGDAFQRVGARQKTSILYLKKKESEDEEQPAVFMKECTALGLEDKPQRTPETEREKSRRATREEIEGIINKYRRFEKGEEGPWVVDPDMIQDRLDVKYCRPHDNPAREVWEHKNVETAELKKVVDVVENETKPGNSPQEKFTFLEISYDGEPRRGKEKFGRDIGYSTVKTAQGGDVIISHINAVHGAICVLPEEMDDLIISTEYTILRVKEEAEINPRYICTLLRSPEYKAMMLSNASGGGRHRIEWDAIKSFKIPLLDQEDQQEFVEDIRTADEMRKEADELESTAISELQEELGLRNQEALNRLEAAMPPS